MLIFFTNCKAEEKEKIIENLKKINSIKFNFTQISNDFTEEGNCIVVYPKKMHCFYEGIDEKEIVVNNDVLLLINKKENKSYIYNIKDTPLSIILDKENILEKLLNKGTFNKINKNIIATINLNNQEDIDIYFDLVRMNILGWKIKNFDKSSLEFLMKNILINIDTKEEFKISE
jgi:outer membrane lipoprotein-sorting protein